MKSKQSNEQRKGREESDPGPGHARNSEEQGGTVGNSEEQWAWARKLDLSLIIYKQLAITHLLLLTCEREKINITCKKLTSSYDVFVLKVKINALLAKTVKFNKGFLILTGKRGGRERSLLAYEEPGRAKVNRANTFIYIYIIYIYSWISALFFFGSPSLSLFMSV